MSSVLSPSWGVTKLIRVEFSEHEAAQLVGLLRRQLQCDEAVWRPYWERLIERVKAAEEAEAKRAGV